MPSQLLRPTELRAIDTFFDNLPNKQDFVNFVQSPDYRDKLHVAVSHLVGYWPTPGEVNDLRAAAIATQRYTMADRMVLDGLEAVRTHDYITDFDADSSSSAEDAVLFEKLYRERPEGRFFYDRFNGLEGMDVVMSKIFNISKLNF